MFAARLTAHRKTAILKILIVIAGPRSSVSRENVNATDILGPPPLARRLPYPPKAAGIVQSFYGFGKRCSPFFGGWLGDRFPPARC